VLDPSTCRGWPSAPWTGCVTFTSARSGLRPRGTKALGAGCRPVATRTARRRFVEWCWRPVVLVVRPTGVFHRACHGRVRYRRGLPGRPRSCRCCPGVTPARAATRRRSPTVHDSGQRHRGYVACLGWSVASRPPLAPTDQPTAGPAIGPGTELARLPARSRSRPRDETSAPGSWPGHGGPLMDHASGGVEPVSSESTERRRASKRSI
jgi:hypothetical protein